MLKFRKQKETYPQDDTWNGIWGADEMLAKQSENRGWTLLWKAMIVYGIVGGGMGCLLSALTVDYHVIIVQFVILIASLFLASLYYHRIWENIGYLLLFFVMVIVAFLLHSYINSGFYAVMNDMGEAVSEYFDSNAMRSYGERVGNRSLAITVSMSYIGVVCCLVINILISRRMRYLFSILAVMAVLMLPLYLELEPSLFFVVQLSWGLFMASSVHRSKHYALQTDNTKYRRKKNHYSYVYSIRTMMQLGICLLVLVGFVSVLLSVIAPKDTFHTKHPASRWKKQTSDTVENLSMVGIAGLFNFYDNVGGLTSGRLGGISALRLDYETDLTLTFVPASEERFYLRQFVGSEYVPVANYWERVPALTSETEEAMQKVYEAGDPYMGKGQILVENVAGQSSLYLPYYSLDLDHLIWEGRSQEYTYYMDFRSIHRDLTDILVQEDDMQQYLAVPEMDEAALDQIILDAGLDTAQEPLANVTQLADYYQQEIPYSYQPGITPYGKDFVDYFLSENKRGYCAHFASAATLIFRRLGIPARYVEGYAIDPEDISEEGEILTTEDTSQYYQGYSALEQTAVVRVNVTDASAHAWVEIWLDGTGWQVADITPASAEEEPGQGLWSMLMRFFQNGSNGAAEQSGGMDDNNTATASTVEHVIQIVLRLAGGLLVLVILIFLLWALIHVLCRTANNRGKNRNDLLIDYYQRHMRKMGHQIEGFDRLQNYEEQVRMLVKQEKILLSEMEQKRLVALLEQAGFSPVEITPEENRWVRQMLR